jgi:hypothetical protein
VPARGYTVRVWHPQQLGSEDDTRQAGGRRREDCARTSQFVVTLKPGRARAARADRRAHAGHY